MLIVHAVVIGFIQGVTEFLPISSSGHLIIIPKLLGWEDQGLAVDAVLHLVTALAIVFYFRHDLWLMVKRWRSSQTLRKLIVASLPAAVIGLLFNHTIENVLRSSWVVVVMLVTVALIMWWVEQNFVEVNVVETKKKPRLLDQVDWPEVIIVGLAQTLAFIPGTSRSGITISAGMWRHVSRVDAARFAFLLGIPVTFGAGLVKLPDLLGAADTNWMYVGVAAITTFGVALASMHWLLRFLQSSTLRIFIYYRVVLAVIVGIFLYLG